VTKTSSYCLFLAKGFIYTTVLQLPTISEYGFTIHCCCRSNTRMLNSPESTIWTAVPSHNSQALQPYSFFALSSDSNAVDPLTARNGPACSLTLQLTSTLIRIVPLTVTLTLSLNQHCLNTLIASTTHSYLNSCCTGPDAGKWVWKHLMTARHTESVPGMLDDDVTQQPEPIREYDDATVSSARRENSLHYNKVKE
jgi:hypothetical protein